MSDIPDPLRELVNAQLMDDETIQWIDQPLSNYWSAGAMIAFAFGIYFTVTSIFSVLFVATGGLLASPMFDIFDVILGFVEVCIHVLIGPFLLFFSLKTRRTCERTVYAITNRRAIIVQRGRSLFNITYSPKDFGDVWCKERGHGTGDIYLRGGEGSLPWLKAAFMNIRNVKEVERMLQELKQTKLPEKL